MSTDASLPAPKGCWGTRRGEECGEAIASSFGLCGDCAALLMGDRPIPAPFGKHRPQAVATKYVVTHRPGGGVLVTEDVDEALAQVRLIVDAGAQATVGKMRAHL